MIFKLGDKHIVLHHVTAVGPVRFSDDHAMVSVFTAGESPMQILWAMLASEGLKRQSKNSVKAAVGYQCCEYKLIDGTEVIVEEPIKLPENSTFKKRVEDDYAVFLHQLDLLK